MILKVNILVSYAYLTESIIKELQTYEDQINLLIDSGAFTAWKQKKEITLNEYCDFMDSCPLKPMQFFTLDEIGNPKRTKDNYIELKSRGYNVLPIFTHNAELDDLEFYYQDTDFIGYGGIAGKRDKKFLQRFNKVLKQINNRQVHLLGVTNEKILKKFKPYSCDSSSWTSAWRYGTSAVYVGNGKMKLLNRLDCVKAPDKQVQQALKRLGFNVGELQNEANWHGANSVVNQVTCRGWVKFSLEAEAILNTRIFLVVVTAEEVKQIIEQFQYLKENKLCPKH